MEGVSCQAIASIATSICILPPPPATTIFQHGAGRILAPSNLAQQVCDSVVRDCCGEGTMIEQSLRADV